MVSDRSILELEGITFLYDGKRPVLQDVSFSLREGQKVGLIGPNGSGKTTLLYLIMGLVHPSRGSIRIFGRPCVTEKDFAAIRGSVGLVFQNADDQLFSPTVLEDVAFGLLNMGLPPREARERAMRTLAQVGLQGYEDRLTHRLSGGEKKLVALATVLTMEPRLLLLDEPVSGLDVETCERIVQILNILKTTCLIVSHEYDFLAQTTRDIYAVREGRVVYDGDSRTLHSHYHAHPYGHVHHHHREEGPLNP